MAAEGDLINGTVETGDESNASSDNPWDDTLLIKAYDKAISLAKKYVEDNEGKEDKSGQDNSKNPNVSETGKKATAEKWKVGSYCRCRYSEDGIEYEAMIVQIKKRQNKAKVKYIGYQNEEFVNIADLKTSQGEIARQEQIQQYLTEQQNLWTNNSPSNLFSSAFHRDCEDISSHHGRAEHGINLSNIAGSSGTSIVPPPPPPSLLSYLPKSEEEALSAMLMSWYMSGYHTGYYQGLKEGNRRKK